MLLSREFTFRVPGLMPPRCVVERLARFHPTVRLAWNPGASCWQLIERGDDMQWRSVKLLRRMLPPRGPRERVRYIPEVPTLANTVFYLDSCDIRAMANRYAVDRWLEGLDQPGEQARSEQSDSERRASDLVGEGAERQWRAEGRKLTLVPDPSPSETA